MLDLLAVIVGVAILAVFGYGVWKLALCQPRGGFPDRARHRPAA